MTLIKTSILSFIATVIKMLSGLVINKAIAVYVGPSGLALIGQFQNFSQLVITIAQGAINNGVTKYTAEYSGDADRLSVLFSTAIKISLLSSVVVGIGVTFFSEQASFYFLKSESYGYVFVIFGFSIILFVINSLLLSILNGLGEIKTYISINITQSVYSLFFTTLLVVFFGLDGALIAFVTNQSVVFFIVLWMLRKHKIIRINNFKRPANKAEIKKLMGFAVMAFTTVATVPVSHLVIRNHIGETLGWDQAGYWQAIWYVSNMYLMVVTTTLSIYYLPKLSRITDKSDLRKELLQGYKLIVPIVIIMSFVIFLLKDFIIWFVFTEEFIQMRELFLWQLIGDVVKLVAWLLAYLMLAKAMTVTFIWTEVLFSVVFVLLAVFFVQYYGLVGVTYAFALNYVLYLFVMIVVTRKELY